MTEPDLILHQFLASHYNEKVRWALAWKGLDHRRVTHLPGPHARAIKRLSGGPTTTPLLQHGEGCVSGSAAIIDFLETRRPEPALYPDEPALRQAALARQAHWDTHVGPAVRTAVFSVFVGQPGYLAATFAAGRPWYQRAGYRALLPFALPLIRKANGVFPENVERAMQTVQETLDELANATSSAPYLVGGAFSVADLTAASLLAPLANPAHPDMRRVTPMPEPIAQLLGRWHGHPALQWVHRMYAEHRPD